MVVLPLPCAFPNLMTSPMRSTMAVVCLIFLAVVEAIPLHIVSSGNNTDTNPCIGDQCTWCTTTDAVKGVKACHCSPSHNAQSTFAHAFVDYCKMNIDTGCFTHYSSDCNPGSLVPDGKAAALKNKCRDWKGRDDSLEDYYLQLSFTIQTPNLTLFSTFYR